MDRARGPTVILIRLFAPALSTSIVAAASSTEPQNEAIAQKQNEVTYRIQKTAMSMPAPVAHTGNLLHAVAFALPLRDDGKIYSGEVTFTASP